MQQLEKDPGCLVENFNVELITPIYGGGVEAGVPDEEMPIRAAAIRGQLRFWWRLLNRASHADSVDLFQAERDVWGGLSEKGATASRVVIRVSKVVKGDPLPCAMYERAEGGRLRGPRWQHRIPGYALFPGQGQLTLSRTGVEEGKEPATVILSLTFKLQVTVRPHAKGNSEKIFEKDVRPALRWWASFGGIGARTRRGLGSIKIEGLEPVSAAEAGMAGCQLVPRDAKKHATAAWNEAVKKLEAFRQGPGIGRNPIVNRTPGRSRWPEADSIREITGCHLDQHPPIHSARQSFPRAVFGLPIITHFKGGPRHNAAPHDRDPDDTTLVPVVSGEPGERMASPLILKAMWTGHEYAPVALLLPQTHIGRMGLKLENDNGPSPTIAAGSWWSSAARSAMTSGTDPNPLQGLSGDVLLDFLTYFRK